MSVINNNNNISVLQFMSVFVWVDILSSLVIYWTNGDDVYLHRWGRADLYMVSGKYLWLALWLLITVKRNIVMGEILMDTNTWNIWRKIFWRMVTVFHHTCKCCIVFKQFDGLNFDGLAGKHQKCHNFPPSKFCAILYTMCSL